MKQKLLKTMLLLCALIVGMGNAWAETKEIKAKWTASSGGLGTGIGSGTITDDQSNSWSYTRTLKSGTSYTGFTSSCIQLGKNGGVENLTISTSALASYTIKEVSVECSSYNGAHKVAIKVGSTTYLSSTATASWTTVNTKKGTGSSKGNIEIQFTDGTRALYIKSISVTYEVDLTDPTITFDDGSIRVGRTLDLGTLFESNSDGAVTYSITAGDSYATLDGSSLTGVAVGDVTIQASQAAKGSYAAATASATIAVTAAKTLSNIAITTAPTKTTYSDGEHFDPTGMVVTATYSDESTENVTALCTYDPDLSTALTTTDTEVVISYTENMVNKTTTQAITVVEYQILPFNWPGGTTSTLNALAGVTANVNATDYADSNAPYYQKMSAVNQYILIHIDSKPSHVYVDVKMLGGSTTSKIKIQECDTEDGTFTDVEELTISGATNTVLHLGTLNPFNASTRYVKIIKSQHGSNIGVGPITITNSESVTVGSAGYTTYVTASNVSFPTGVSAYMVTAINTNTIHLEEILDAPVGAALILEADEGTYALEDEYLGLYEEVGTNLLQASDGTVEGDGSTILALANKSGIVGFYPVGVGVKVPAGKAYLNTDGTPVKEFLGFDFGEDGVQSLKDGQFTLDNTAIFNLAGQRMSKLQRGINIVNGKKIIVK